MKITIELTKGQLNSISKQLASVDSVAVVEQVVEVEVPAPAPTPSKTTPAWASTCTRKANPAEYSAANKAALRRVNAFVGQARVALKEGNEKGLVEALKQAHAVCRARVEAGASSFVAMADGLEGRIAR